MIDDPISPPAALGAALMLLVAALAFTAGFAAADEPATIYAPGGGL